MLDATRSHTRLAATRAARMAKARIMALGRTAAMIHSVGSVARPRPIASCLRRHAHTSLVVGPTLNGSNSAALLAIAPSSPCVLEGASGPGSKSTSTHAGSPGGTSCWTSARPSVVRAVWSSALAA